MGRLSSPTAVVGWIGNVAISPYQVIDSRIDVGAQKAILRMLKSTPRVKADAVGMLAAVKSGRLSGIFGDDLAAAARLAARLGTVRWELVPRGQDAVFLRPPSDQPVIIFREGARSVVSRLDPALRQAYRAFASRTISASRRDVAFQSVSASPTDPIPAAVCAFFCALCAAAILDGVPFDEIVPCEICLACATGVN